jgi:hypothetical protein
MGMAPKGAGPRRRAAGLASGQLGRAAVEKLLTDAQKAKLKELHEPPKEVGKEKEKK